MPQNECDVHRTIPLTLNYYLLYTINATSNRYLEPVLHNNLYKYDFIHLRLKLIEDLIGKRKMGRWMFIIKKQVFVSLNRS